MADLTVSTDTAPTAPPTATAPAGSKAPKDKNDAEYKAIYRCMRAWNYAYDKEAADLDEDDPDNDAWKAASEAYLRATPPLSGYENICHFIACINYASMTEIVTHREAQHYLSNAKLALSAVLRQPKPSTGEPKRLGRPPKARATEEIK